MKDILAAIEKQQEAFEAFKATNDKRVAALEKGDTSKAAELNATLEKIEADVAKFGALKASLAAEQEVQKERIEELEARAAAIKGGDPVEKAKADHKAAFVKAFRTQFKDASAVAEMEGFAKKGVTIASPAGGGYGVPEEIARDIQRLEKKISPVRDLVKFLQVGTSDYKELVNIRGGTGGWVGESGSRTATNTPELRECAPLGGELYAYPQASEWSLDDVFFDVAAWLAEETADVFGSLESTAVFKGSGSNQLKGMTHTAPVSTADFASPLRAATAYQFIACLTSLSPAVAEVRLDPMIDLLHTLNDKYRANGRWAMNSLTAGAVRKIKDSNGQYLWEPSAQAGTPDILLGKPVTIWEQMDDVGTNMLPIAFGDFKKAYTLVERIGMRITVDQVTNIGFVKYYIRRREAGIPTNNDAVKFLKTTIA